MNNNKLKTIGYSFIDLINDEAYFGFIAFISVICAVSALILFAGITLFF